MTRIAPRTQLVATLVLAGIGLWLFFGDGIELAGRSLGFVGVWLFVAAAWFFVDAVQRVPRSEAEQTVAPGEWLAWVGVVFLGAVLVALALAGDAFTPHAPIQQNPQAGEAGRGIGALFVAWVVLAWVLRQRWKDGVVEDERDRRIEQVAGSWGRAATTFLVVGVAVMLSFSPTARLQEFSYPFLGHLLMFALAWGAWFDHLAAAVLYWRDRRVSHA